jgi:hypothetical protein
MFSKKESELSSEAAVAKQDKKWICPLDLMVSAKQPQFYATTTRLNFCSEEKTC